MSNLPDRYTSIERKMSQKNPKYIICLIDIKVAEKKITEKLGRYVELLNVM